MPDIANRSIGVYDPPLLILRYCELIACIDVVLDQYLRWLCVRLTSVSWELSYNYIDRSQSLL